MNGLNNINANSGTFEEIDVNTLVVNISGTAPTVTPLSNDNNIATTAWVTTHAGGSYVTLDTSQTLTTGIKTFTNLPQSSAVPSVGDELVNKTFTDATYVDFVNNETIGGVKTFSSLPQSSVVPTLGDELVNKTFTDATYVDFVNNETIGGVKTFSSLPQSSAVPSVGDDLVNKTFTDATYVDFVNNETIGGVKTFSSLPQSSAVPSVGDDLVNKTFVDGAISAGSFVTTNTTQSISGAKTFTTNTLKAEAGITVKNGASAQTATLTQNATTLDVIGAGDISIKPTNDFNVVTGTGKNISISSPSTALLPSTQTFDTGVSNASSYIAFASPTTYILGISTQPSLILSGGYGTIYGWQFTRGGTNIAAINRINSQNTADTCYLEVNEGQNITLTNGVTSITGNFLIQQTTYPPSNNSALGYTDSETTLTDPMNNTLTARSDFSLPSKGVWLIICGYEWNTNTSNTVESKLLVLSLTSAGTTPVAYGLDYYEEINDAAGASGDRQKGTLSGVVSVTGSTIIYVNARSQVNSGTNTELRTNITWTRIG
jgi:hypothetical protein